MRNTEVRGNFLPVLKKSKNYFLILLDEALLIHDTIIVSCYFVLVLLFRKKSSSSNPRTFIKSNNINDRNGWKSKPSSHWFWWVFRGSRRRWNRRPRRRQRLPMEIKSILYALIWENLDRLFLCLHIYVLYLAENMCFLFLSKNTCRP